MAGFKTRALSGAGLCAVILAPTSACARPTDQIDYAARKGDTLIGLGRRYFVDPRSYIEVQRLNHIREERRIPIGTVLHVPRRLLRFDPITFRVTSFSGPVSATLGNQTLTLLKGLTLDEGTQLMTGPNGFVALTGADGSRVAMPSNSRIRIVHARHYLMPDASDVDFGIDQGRAEVRAAKQKTQDQFQIRSPVAVSAVRGTVFRAGLNGEGSAGNTEVIEGTVAVASPRAEIAVPSGFGASVAASGEIAKEALLASLTLNDPARIQTDAAVHFTFTPVAAARRYHIQIARDAGFEQVLAEQDADAPQAEFSGLGNGTFFLRATAIAASGLEGLPEIWSFRRQRVGLAAEVGQTALPGGFRVNWHAEGEGRSIFRFQLFAAAKPEVPVVDEAGLVDPGITLTSLKRGAYQWRVGVTQITPEGSADVWTPLQKFTVSN